MRPWELHDYKDVIEDKSEIPKTLIRSEDELRAQLAAFRERSPGLVLLESPEKEHLEIAIGGPLAGLKWGKPPVHKFLKRALADEIRSIEAVTFYNQGINTEVEPTFLLPVETVVEAALFFFHHHQLPPWISWREWDAAQKIWKVIPAQPS